jgi:hypothetical protein
MFSYVEPYFTVFLQYLSKFATHHSSFTSDLILSSFVGKTESHIIYKKNQSVVIFTLTTYPGVLGIRRGAYSTMDVRILPRNL